MGGGEEGERGEEEDEVEEGGQAQIEGRLGSAGHDDVFSITEETKKRKKKKREKSRFLVSG